MNIKKVTIRIVFTFLTVIALGSMIASCSTEEFEGPRKTLATRSAAGAEPSDMVFGDTNFFYIPSSLRNQTGCGYKAIIKALELKNYSCNVDTIKDIMRQYCNDVEYYKEDSLVYAIQDITCQAVATFKGAGINENTPAVGDIICVPPREYKDSVMLYGHATVVQSIEPRTHYKLLHCFDGCLFDTGVLSLVIKTSNINKK